MTYKYTGVNTIDTNNCGKMEFSLDFIGAKDNLPKRKIPTGSTASCFDNNDLHVFYFTAKFNSITHEEEDGSWDEI